MDWCMYREVGRMSMVSYRYHNEESKIHRYLCRDQYLKKHTLPGEEMLSLNDALRSGLSPLVIMLASCITNHT